MANQRVLRSIPATISATFTDQNGSPANPSGTVTVHVVRSDGSTVLPAGTATTSTGAGGYTAPLTAAHTAQLDELTATWTASGGAVVTTTVDVVGSYYFTTAEATASDASLASYSTADIVQARHEVEEEAERICGVAFVPRYRRIKVWGNGTTGIQLPHRKVRKIRSVAWGNINLAQVALDNMVVEASGLITRYWPFMLDPTDEALGLWGGRFPQGYRVTVGYEHGFDTPPPDVKRAVLLRLRHRLNASSSGVPDRAVSFSIADGGTYNLSAPGENRTGIPDVDSVYTWYRRRFRVERSAASVQVG